MHSTGKGFWTHLCTCVLCACIAATVSFDLYYQWKIHAAQYEPVLSETGQSVHVQ